MNVRLRVQRTLRLECFISGIRIGSSRLIIVVFLGLVMIVKKYLFFNFSYLHDIKD